MPTKSSFSEAFKHIWFNLRILGLPLILRSIRYSFEKTYAELKYAEPMKPRGGLKLWWQAIKEDNNPRPAPPPFDTFSKPGGVQSWRVHEATLTLVCERTHLQLMALSPSIIRVRMNERGIFNILFSYAVQKPDSDWPPPTVRVDEQDEFIYFETSLLTLRIDKKKCTINFLDKQGRPINLDAGGVGWRENWVGIERALPLGDPVFGLGEQAAPLNLRGRRFEMWNRDPGGEYAPGETPLYQSHPWFTSFSQNGAFGMLVDNSYRSHVDLGYRRPERYTFSASGGEMRYYFIYGPEIKAVLAHLAELTGKMPLPPLWALGLHQSRWSYKSSSVVRSIARQFRDRQIPCDAIHLDLHHMHNKQSFTWSRGRFPRPKSMLRGLRQDGFRLIPIVDPGIKADRLNDLAERGLKENFFLKYPDGRVFRGPVWPGDCYFPDFTDPAVRIWWGELHRSFLQEGIAGFWVDMNEPAVFGLGDGTIPNPVCHNFEGRQADHGQMHNVYGMQMARATQEGVSALRSQQRPFVLSRSGSVGIQRYAAVWTGDNASTWEHLRLSICMVLNLGLSGVPFSGADIGGFWGTPSPELFARWIQAAALFPLCRIHTANLTPNQEPWSFGPQVEAIAKRTIDLRYRLLPYLYTTFWQASQTGSPIVRPMFFDFQDDAQTYSLEDQFMVGESLLVAPVLTPDTDTRPVYLPQGHTWVDYWRGEYYAGGQTITVEAPLTELPIFVKAGAVLPHWPVIQHTDQAKTLEGIAFHIYAGSGQSSFYEDLGEGLSYLREEYRQTQFVCHSAPDRLIVTTRTQGKHAPPYQIVFWIIHLPQPVLPTAIIADGLPISDWFGGALSNSITFQTPIVQRLEIWF